ncbi:hypothetical protein QIH87_50220 (plasmid) [Bradyrhizobium elkanii]|uniref:hypothetical protein n=1 Tax=Bradyrhizobium elkanii TaxID=29448 RepID=UPI0027149BC9|nr:hypothetical protein [Bradyrhizobium elkanii]WLB14808.1 hypothetical protein QIH87_50220 [Bradyrhizobium elkanii]WLB69101.1 hypothetical protein QIH89_27695 [Bradyrhizobium elkanii]
MSIIEDFVSLNAELLKLEQAKAPNSVQPDLSNSGDVTDEARKTFYGMFGYPTGGAVGGIDDMGACLSAGAVPDGLAYSQSRQWAPVPISSITKGAPIKQIVNINVAPKIEVSRS